MFISPLTFTKKLELGKYLTQGTQCENIVETVSEYKRNTTFLVV